MMNAEWNEERAPSSAFPFVICKMREQHIPAVMEIERRSFPTPWPEAAYRHELRPGSDSSFAVLLFKQHREPERPLTWRERLLGAPERCEASVVGYWGLRFYVDEAHLSTIAVHPDWRGRGLGEYLLLTAIDYAARRGARRVTLEVRITNRVAQNLYIKSGFVRTDVRPAYYSDGEDAWLMSLKLDRPRLAALGAHMLALEQRLSRLEISEKGR